MGLNEFLFHKLAEELSETAVEALKCGQYGVEASHPAYINSNKERLRRELNDVYALLHLIKRNINIDLEPDAKHIDEKVNVIAEQWELAHHIYSIQELMAKTPYIRDSGLEIKRLEDRLISRTQELNDLENIQGDLQDEVNRLTMILNSAKEALQDK